MVRTLHCKLCNQFLVYVNNKNLVCFNEEDKAIVHAYNKHVMKRNLIFEEFGNIRCARCYLKLGVYNDTCNFVTFFRYKLVEIKKDINNKAVRNEIYKLPLEGREFEYICYGIDLNYLSD